MVGVVHVTLEEVLRENVFHTKHVVRQHGPMFQCTEISRTACEARAVFEERAKYMEEISALHTGSTVPVLRFEDSYL